MYQSLCYDQQFGLEQAPPSTSGFIVPPNKGLHHDQPPISQVPDHGEHSIFPCPLAFLHPSTPIYGHFGVQHSHKGHAA